MDNFEDVRSILVETLGIGERGAALARESVLLGDIPEFDSMAVVSVITALEEEFGFIVDDDEISAETFETLGTLSDFVTRKLAA